MPADFDQRAANLAVSRFGADPARVDQAAQAVEREQAAGGATTLVDRLVSEQLLTREQAQALLGELADGHVEVKVSEPTPVPALNDDQIETKFPEASPDPMPTRSGYYLRTIGEYRVLRRLGEGGMGTVYLGYHEGRGEHVAIKVLADALANNSSYLARFHREAKNGLRIDHPNVVRYLAEGHDKESGKHYLVMEYVDGPSTRMLLNNFGKLPVGDAVHITLSIARALDYVHARNFVHRDIKPDNILVTNRGIPKLADLGLAKCMADDISLTARHQGFGTPYYMPCEQASDAKIVDGRSDIFALGATLYHLITGQVPFPGKTHVQVAERKLTGKFTPASRVNPAVPSALDRIINKMMAHNPGDRYQSAKELISDLECARLDSARLSLIKGAAGPGKSSDTCELTGEQTVLDAAEQGNGAVDPNIWYVRYKGADGQACKVRATTWEIQERLRSGQYPASAEVGHAVHGDFQPLSQVKEFQRTPAAVATAPTPRTALFQDQEAPPPAARSGLRTAALLIGFLIIAAVSGWLMFFFRH